VYIPADIISAGLHNNLHILCVCFQLDRNDGCSDITCELAMADNEQ
jgi:hypothetical protein